MENTKKVPVLRFPEFNEEWNIEKLKKFIIEHKGGAPLQPKDFVKYSQYEVIPKKSIIKGGYLQLDIENPTFCSEKFFNSYNNSVINNSYLITTLRDLVPSAPSIGYIVKIKNEKSYILAQGVYGLKINKEILSEDFLIQFSNTDNYREVMQTIKVGSTQVHIRNNDFFKITIGVPSKKEQQKIADFLSQIDNRIEKLTKKKQLLESYKKGVMKKIFNQELRFKDDKGNDYLDWETKELGEILTYEQPTKYLVDSVEYNNKYKTPVLTAGKTFILGYTNEETGIFKNDLPVIIFDDFTKANKFVDFEFKAKSSAMKILKKIDDTVNIKYIYEVMQLITLPSGDEHKRYWISEYQYLTIDLPCFEEQTKIANFLTEIDDKINLVSKQLEGTKQYKQGLLQKMFV